MPFAKGAKAAPTYFRALPGALARSSQNQIQREKRMQKEWWYSAEEKKMGPHSYEEMKALIENGTLSRRHLAWKQGFENWLPIADIGELSGAFAAIPPDIPEPSERDLNIELKFAGPWRRFLARLIDLWAISLPTALLVAVVGGALSIDFALWIQEPGSQYAFGWLILPLVLFIEAVVFGIFGSTLGKALLGIKVTTAAAFPVRFSQYAKRLVGVYWYGLGTGFPLVSLFTMARQYGRLKEGKFARYDEGGFNVKAKKIGFLRSIFAIAMIVGLFAINVVLQVISQEADRAYYSGFNWTNVVNGRTVQIPAGWVHDSQENIDNQPINVFSAPRVGIFAIFAKEDVDSSMSLNEYASLWSAATEGTMSLSPFGQPTSVRGFSALQISGTMTDDRSQRIDAVLVKRGNEIWRILFIGTDGRDPIPAEAVELRNILFSSIE